ncbi:MAG TPA: hypothetical protein VG456_24755 [Candidatus Sulfopaludibacter sp.]|jgi:endonuclease III|nr:hypothetical protein [Candidatus Sulfopaludibacter sp.]
MADITVSEVLDKLESHYGVQSPEWPTEPYEFLVWWHCGYPASDAACARGWDSLTRATAIQPRDLLAAGIPKLAESLKCGGMVPELRALRLIEIAQRVERECAGDLQSALVGSIAQVRKLLQKFPNIAGPGADRILLFGGIAPIAAVPSNCPHVLVRLLRGKERENYGVTYRQAQQAIEAQVPEKFDARTRAYLLLKHHGQQLCKRTNAKCSVCPLRSSCKAAG